METVDALRDLEQINSMKEQLKKQSYRDYLLFVVGINTGLKISELLLIKVKELFNSEGEIKDFYHYSEMESERRKTVFLNNKVKEAVLSYLNQVNREEQMYLFQSRKFKQPITRQQAYRIIHEAAVKVGIEGKIGTNSLAKTFGFHAFKQGVSIALLQKHFNHSTPAETLKFLGITKEDVITTQIDVNL
ncbi:tyrosine-type recombinase/integrase [Bacillus sp. ISL-18]|uniref:tyrosine-type recombinase/integrase n=1 Tax=Bacillus sp. ISL-18 TaxID=2819118 RepID=UPI001BEA7E59|nr:tyrosine-type recombinase/integrase [Bacillus sp. ISL-18]MBT2659002.1 tyrosine-type recombinase/integrase [Bacillus sp. ISL-18]